MNNSLHGYHNKDCPPSLKLLGDFWTLYIINVLRDGEVRFCMLRRNLNNINPVTLTDRLKKLEADNIIQRNIETVDKQSVSYSLTALGKEALPIIDAYRNFDKVIKKQLSLEAKLVK